MASSVYSALWAAYLDGDDSALYSLDIVADDVINGVVWL